MIEWDEYEATIRFEDRLIGGIPVMPAGSDPQAYEGWLRGQKVENDPSFEKGLAEVLAADSEMPVAVAEDAPTEQGFRRGKDGLYVEARQVKAAIKEGSQRLGLLKSVRGMRQVIQHDIHVRALDGTQRLYLARAEPDGKDARPISVLTPQGPRQSIKRFEYVNQPEIRFVVRVLKGGIGEGMMTEDLLRDVLELCGSLGLGADRSQGEGTFVLEELKRI